MSRPKLVLLIVLVVVGGFLAVFVPSVATALGDDDEVSTTELSLAPSVLHDESAPAAPLPQQTRHPSVDRDCYEDGIVCKKERLDDAINVAELVTPIMSNAGWPAGCFEVGVIGGDNGGPDAITIALNGRPKLGSPKCREPEAGGAQKSQVTRVAQAVKIVVRKATVSNVDLLQVTNGDDAEIQINLK